MDISGWHLEQSLDLGKLQPLLCSKKQNQKQKTALKLCRIGNKS